MPILSILTLNQNNNISDNHRSRKKRDDQLTALLSRFFFSSLPTNYKQLQVTWRGGKRKRNQHILTGK